MAKRIASFSGGKDSTAMVLRLLEEHEALDGVVFYDTGAEFQAIYKVAGQVRERCEQSGVEFTILKPDRPFFYDMLILPVNYGKDDEHYGYEWCGGITRWGTCHKVRKIDEFCGDAIQLVGIAADEARRAKGKRYPLIEWGMTERDCLDYCKSNGISWDEDGVDLYRVLDRVSCWCCKNKSIKELRNMYHNLPYYWSCLRGLQSRIDRPFKNGKTIFDLEERFKQEDDMRLFKEWEL